MSKTDNLHDYVQGIVNTVAKKKEYPAGTVINAQDVESEIMSIESGVKVIGTEEIGLSSMALLEGETVLTNRISSVYDNLSYSISTPTTEYTLDMITFNDNILQISIEAGSTVENKTIKYINSTGGDICTPLNLNFIGTFARFEIIDDETVVIISSNNVYCLNINESAISSINTIAYPSGQTASDFIRLNDNCIIVACTSTIQAIKISNGDISIVSQCAFSGAATYKMLDGSTPNKCYMSYVYTTYYTTSSNIRLCEIELTADDILTAVVKFSSTISNIRMSSATSLGGVVYNSNSAIISYYYYDADDNEQYVRHTPLIYENDIWNEKTTNGYLFGTSNTINNAYGNKATQLINGMIYNTIFGTFIVSHYDPDTHTVKHITTITLNDIQTVDGSVALSNIYTTYYSRNIKDITWYSGIYNNVGRTYMLKMSSIIKAVNKSNINNTKLYTIDNITYWTGEYVLANSTSLTGAHTFNDTYDMTPISVINNTNYNVITDPLRGFYITQEHPDIAYYVATSYIITLQKENDLWVTSNVFEYGFSTKYISGIYRLNNKLYVTTVSGYDQTVYTIELINHEPVSIIDVINHNDIGISFYITNGRCYDVKIYGDYLVSFCLGKIASASNNQHRLYATIYNIATNTVHAYQPVGRTGYSNQKVFFASMVADEKVYLSYEQPYTFDLSSGTYKSDATVVTTFPGNDVGIRGKSYNISKNLFLVVDEYSYLNTQMYKDIYMYPNIQCSTKIVTDGVIVTRLIATSDRILCSIETFYSGGEYVIQKSITTTTKATLGIIKNVEELSIPSYVKKINFIKL